MLEHIPQDATREDFYRAREYLEAVGCSDDTTEDEHSEIANIWLLLNGYFKLVHGDKF